MPLPNLIPPFAPKNNDGSPIYNCTFWVRNSVSTGTTNALGNPVFDSDMTAIEGWSVRETNPQLLETIGASVEETPIKIWIQDPKCLPANFASFNNVRCELDLGGKRVGLFRPVPMAHPFVPSNFQFVIGAFKGVNA
jgi:hypothetical protein